MNKEVNKYMAKQKSPQREICKELRRMILKTFPKIDEKVKMGVAWYGKYYIVGLKDSVNLGVSVEGLSKKDRANFEGIGKFMGHIKFRELKEIDEKKLVKLLKLVDKKAKRGSCFR
jgi:hypothetical protein